MKYYGDYLGFQFAGHHSRDLGLYRVSDGDRYNDVSVPNFTDNTSPKPGNDGTYYWDSFYTQRTFTVNCAFDDLSEAQLRKIRQIFDGKVVDWLIFDETPYKKYRVKLQNPPQIKYLTFRGKLVGQGEDAHFDKLRVHKGEITFQFISYYPYAIDNFKTYDNIDYPNVDEWYESVPLLKQSELNNLNSNNILSSDSGAGYFIYNPGDLSTDVKLIFDKAVTAPPSNLTIVLKHRIQSAQHSASSSAGDLELNSLRFSNLTLQSGDRYLVVDTATNLIYGENQLGKQTGNLYNQYLTGGEFFKLPVTQEQNTAVSSELVDYCDYVWVNVARSSGNNPNFKMEYNYLYY